MQQIASQTEASATNMGVGRVHVFETGRLTANKTFLRGEGFRSLFKPVKQIEFPVLAYVVEHPEGLIVIDTGLGSHVTKPRTFRGFPPVPTKASPALEIGSQMRKRGLDPSDVRRVILTHLDWDHTGGLHYFPAAEVLVHSPEYEFAQTRMGRARYRPSLWPERFAPDVYELEAEPFGPFPASRPVTDAGDLRIIPIPGHAPGQVAVALDTGDVTLLFSADHMLRADWFVEDLRAERLIMMGAFGKEDARQTSQRLQQLAEQRPVVLLPAHDSAAPERLARRERTSA
jgi:glyoxylase-like metal-dependent hydrolase (beta-lactamase superfamily II)